MATTLTPWFIGTQGFILALHYVMISGQKYNFEEELAFYGSYHQHPVNQAIHFVFIPSILWSAITLLAYFDIFGLNLSLHGHRITWATSTFVIYVVYYNLLDPFGGRIYSLLLLLMYLSSTYWVGKELGMKEKSGANAKPADATYSLPVWKIALIIQVVAWYMQIHPGHAIFEGVKPALFDSLSQAFSVAPLFAFYEGLWFAGFQHELKQQVVDLVTAQRQTMCQQDSTYPFCT